MSVIGWVFYLPIEFIPEYGLPARQLGMGSAYYHRGLINITQAVPTDL